MRGDEALRKAYADLRETCAYAIDPRQADRDLARLLVRYLDADASAMPVSPRFEAVLERLPPSERGGLSALRPRTSVRSLIVFLRDGIDTLLGKHLDVGLRQVWALDPWAGEGELAASLDAKELFANEADPVRYARMVSRVGKGAILADSFRLPERRLTPGFDFGADENVARVDDEQAALFAAVASDLRGDKDLEGKVRWMAGRLAPRGVVAFLSGSAFVDEPAFAPLRAWLAREFGLVAHLRLPDDEGVSFLVRGAGGGRVLFAEAEDEPSRFEEAEWRELHPTPAHVWRTEILREEWAGFLPLAQTRGAIFSQADAGLPDGEDAAGPGPKTRRVLRRPFVPAWRTLDRKARREGVPNDGPRIVVLSEPFGVLATNGPVDRRFGGAGALTAGGRPAAEALRRFRGVYGAAVTESDLFDAVLALLHHPEYRVRYHEDLRRSVPRLPLPDEEALAALGLLPDAPPVGPGSAFRTGWLDDALFEPGTLPDYDDPFASPFARDDVDPGFLRLVGLGAALFRVQVDFERLRPHPLVQVGEPGPFARMRLSTDRTRLTITPTWRLEGIPPEAFVHRIGLRSAPEWVVEGLRAGKGFDPNHADEPERPARLFGQAVAASLEIRRLAAIVGTIRL